MRGIYSRRGSRGDTEDAKNAEGEGRGYTNQRVDVLCCMESEKADGGIE